MLVPKEVFTFFKTPEQERLNLVRGAVRGMSFEVVPYKLGYAPVRFFCDLYQAMQLLELFRLQVPSNQLGLVSYAQVPISADLTRRMPDGILPVTGGKNLETTVVSIFKDRNNPDQRCLFHFGYSTNGTSVLLTPQNQLQIVVNERSDIIALQSLQKLFQITLDPRFSR
ncbi:MAG: hypothetical protein NZM26_04930 [Patescibacteria group bacterium]|nr:hypothetical protein [Patescibacteria group bacterium]